MHPNLGEVLHWAAFWIAVVVALLGLAAWITGSDASWIGAGTFLAVAVAIWLLGRLSLWLSALKGGRARRER
ncbi:MAG TPA: hypothetical protein VNH44_08925 [Micropepsaceae bacterium]|nr:hypothetical protein [Micropepsaceae bacterium]